MDRLESGRNRILDAQTHVPRTAKIHGNSFSAPPIHQGVSFIKGCPLNGPSVEQSRKASRGLSLQIVSLHPKNANIPADEKPFQIDHQPNTCSMSGVPLVRLIWVDNWSSYELQQSIHESQFKTQKLTYLQSVNPPEIKHGT